MKLVQYVLIFVILSMDGEHFVVNDMMTLQVKKILKNLRFDAKC